MPDVAQPSPGAAPFAVVLDNITKSYGTGQDKAVAVDRVTFSVNAGELFGLIGADGAGKTSLFRMLTTLLLPDAGRATVNGFDIVRQYEDIRRCVGYMPGRFSLYQDLTVEENLRFFATVFGTTIERNYELIRDIYVQIEPFRKRRAGKLSGGMKQKLALCCALIHRPAILFLDEPTTGVDPVSRKEFWQMLHRLKTQGITIVVSTPYMDEASLCDRIAFIDRGRILSIATPEAMIEAYPSSLYAVHGEDTYRLLKALEVREEVSLCYAFGDRLHLVLRDDTAEGVNAFAGVLEQAGGARAERVKPSIEDCFIRLLSN